MKNIWLWKWAFFACALVIIGLAMAPQSVWLPSTGWDKLNHAIAFGVLYALGTASWPNELWRVAAGVVLYGAAIEVLQAWSGYRDGELLDLLADALGVAVVAAGQLWWRKMGRERG